MSRVLIVEDNADLAFGLRASLEAEGHTVMVADDGHAGLARVRDWQPQLVILDLMLPHVDGYTVLQTVRAEGNNVPVLILTARGAETDIVRGFHLGADDHVTKPFGLSVLLARVRALLRRAELIRQTLSADQGEAGPILRDGPLSLDPQAHLATLAGAPLDVSPTEFAVLALLLRSPGRTFSRTYLVETVWREKSIGGDRSVDNAVLRLRKKLGSLGDAIETVWGIGYRWRPADGAGREEA